MDKIILEISVNSESGEYKMRIAEGSNLAETMFAISAMIRCLVRDGIIENSKVATDLLNKYLNDSQYEEVSNDNI